MLGNGIKQTSTTGGTGALTLSAVVGSVAASQAFAINQPLAYSIYTGGDTAPVFREAGIGYLSAANTLVRAKVQATFDGSTYNPVNPTATDFGGAAITVICTPNAATLESMLPNVDTVSASVLRYLSSAHHAAYFVPTGPSTNTPQYVPFLLRSGAPITSLMVNVTTLVAGSTGRIGLYTCSEKGYPGILLATSGDLDFGSTGAKVYTFPSPMNLPPGWYFTGFVATTGSLRLSGYSVANGMMQGGSPLGFSAPAVPTEWRNDSNTMSTLPAVASTSTAAVPAAGTSPVAVFLGL